METHPAAHPKAKTTRLPMVKAASERRKKRTEPTAAASERPMAGAKKGAIRAARIYRADGASRMAAARIMAVNRVMV